MQRRIFCNYAMSADGKISTVDRRGSAFSSRADRVRVERIRAMADVIVVGGETVRRDDPPFHLRTPALIQERIAAGRAAQPDVCIITRSGELPEELAIFHQTHQAVLVATPTADYRPHQSASARVAPILLPEFRPVEALLGSLPFQNYREILVEGGSRVNALFLESALMDEIYLTICPVVLGGAAAPTPVAGPGFTIDRRIRLRLLDQDKVDGELFLHYAVERDRT